MQRNLAIAGGRQVIEVATAVRQAASLKPNPTLQLGAEQIPFASPLAGSFPRLFATNADAGANPVYTAQFGRLIERGGKRELRAQQAGALVDAAKAQLTDTFRQQLLQLRQSFTNALFARENLRIAEALDREYGETVRLMNLRLRAGDIAKVDFQRVEVSRISFQQSVIDARTAYHQAVRDVVAVLGGPANDSLELTGKLEVPAPPPPLEELRATALKERPDYAAALANVRASERGTRLAEAQRVRDIYTAIEYQRVGFDHSAGATVSMPLFLFNNQKAGIAQAVAQERLSDIQRRQVEQQLLAEVDKAYQALTAARQIVNLFGDEAVVRANEIRETVNYSYHRGEASLLEFIEAQRSAMQTTLQHNQAIATHLNAFWQLEAAVGRPF